MSTITEFDYNKDVNDTAIDLVQTAYDNLGYDGKELTRENAEELINDSLLHETIDGHQWIIYYAYNLDVLKYSRNADYMNDNFGADSLADALSKGGINSLHTALAFWALYADVQDQLSSALDDYERQNESEAV